MTEELLREQNKILKSLVSIMVELLPRHAADCYGLQVHPGNTARCCDCDMSKIREQIRGLEITKEITETKTETI